MKIFKSKKGIELTVSFMVKLIMAIVIFSFGIWFATTIFSTGGELTDKSFSDWDKQVAGLSCSPGQKVCIPRTTMETDSENGIVFGLVIKNVFDEERNFRYWVEGHTNNPEQPSSFVDQGGNDALATLNTAGDTFNFIPDSTNFRLIEGLGSGKDVSMVVVIQHIGGTRGTAAFTVVVEAQATSGGSSAPQGWMNYGKFKVYHRTI